MTKEKITPEQRSMKVMETKAHELRENMPGRETLVNTILGGLGSKALVRLSENGDVTVHGLQGKPKTFRPDHVTLNKGTVFQTPAHASMSVALAQACTEAEFFHTLKASCKAGAPTALVRQIVQLSMYGTWYLPDDEELRKAGATGRKLSVKSRPRFAKALDMAHTFNETTGMRNLRQTVASIPALMGFVPLHELVRRTSLGESPAVIASHFAGMDAAALRNLHKSALPLVSQGNVQQVIQILRCWSAGNLDLKAKQGVVMEELLAVMGQPEPVRGFYDWLALQAGRNPAQLQQGVLPLILYWVSETTNERGGWNSKMSLAAAAMRAFGWEESQIAADKARKQEVQKEREALAFPNNMPSQMTDPTNKLLVRQLRSAEEMHAIGERLSVCLSSLWASFSRRVMAGEIALVGIFSCEWVERDGKDGKEEVLMERQILSVAEVTLPNFTIVQHRAKLNGKPKPTAVAALHQYLHPEIEDFTPPTSGAAGEV